MTNAIAMYAQFESKKNTQAAIITAAFAGLMLLLMFLLKWTIPVFEPINQQQEILVDLQLPEEDILPPAKHDGGGGGGNPVEAPGERGTASAPPQPGTKDDAKDIEEDKTEKETPPILKPDNPKPTATKINENKSVVTAKPTPNPLPPAPQKPKAVLGKTTSGNGAGGGVSTTYDRAGGSGTGSGVGNGSGSGGGSGTGSGGGNGSGTGRGSGPRVVSGDRRIVQSYAFQGELDKATIYANITVSPEGAGSFLSIARGSSSTSAAYKNAIQQYLRNMRFNKSDHESVVTVLFNFVVN